MQTVAVRTSRGAVMHDLHELQASFKDNLVEQAFAILITDNLHCAAILGHEDEGVPIIRVAVEKGLDDLAQALMAKPHVCHPFHEKVARASCQG